MNHDLDGRVHLWQLDEPILDCFKTFNNRRRCWKPHRLTPRPFLVFGSTDFCFSGLKAGVARDVEKAESEGQEISRADVAASFREAVVDVLLTKALWACEEKGVSRLLLGGGVVANARVREEAKRRCDTLGIDRGIPRFSLCTDNGAMVAALGAQLIMDGREPSGLGFGADSTLSITKIQTP